MIFGIYLLDCLMALLLVSICILFFPLFFPGYYVTELFISFLPYIVSIAGLFVVFSFVYLRKTMRLSYRFPRHRYFRGVSFLLFCFLFFWYSKQFNHFYFQDLTVPEEQSGSLTVLFSNIHKDNVQYEKIKETISKANPDILMFVEFSDHHYLYLKNFLQEKYPYSNTTTRSKKFVGSMVFSKYPLSNKADDFPQGMRKYGYFSLPYANQQIYFYLVHTSSPDSYNHFLMRNEQLTTFVNDFEAHESDRKHNNIVAVGDFNITPWSSYYDILSTAFSGRLNNITQRIPFLFTRKFKSFPLFQAHIDHLRASPSLIVQTLSVITMPGSDHKAFLFTLHL